MTDYSAVGRKSKSKGARFELETAKNLSKWWGHDFHRVPASGGLHWKGSNNVVGDIVAPIEAGFPFVVECKNREEWTIENLFLNNKEIKNWWAQVVGDAKESGKIPMLIFTRNRAKTFVMMAYNKDLIKEIEDRGYPLMVSNVEYVDGYKDTHCYKTFTTVLEAITSFKPRKSQGEEHLLHYFNPKEYDWQKSGLIRETKKMEEAKQLDVEESLDLLVNSYLEGEK